MFCKYIHLCLSVLVFFFKLNIILCIFQGQSGKLLVRRLTSLIPGSEILSWLKEVKICEEPYSSFVTSLSFHRYRSHYANVNRIFKIKKVNIQVPFNGCNEWKGILLCLVFVPLERHWYPSEIYVYSVQVDGHQGDLMPFMCCIGERYCKFESHHLWLVYFFRHLFDNPYRMRGTCSSIDAKGFRQVEIKIATVSVEAEKIGFGLVYSNRNEEERISRQYLLL